MERNADCNNPAYIGLDGNQIYLELDYRPFVLTFFKKKKLTIVCLCPENLSVELKTNGLICSMEEVSGHKSVGHHGYCSLFFLAESYTTGTPCSQTFGF